jgi:hypothetical protein
MTTGYCIVFLVQYNSTSFLKFTKTNQRCEADPPATAFVAMTVHKFLIYATYLVLV